MKVLQINSVCGFGSTGRIATDIHKVLVEEGHESYIAYGRGEAREIDEKFTIKIGNKLDNYFHVAKTRFFDKHGLGSKKATKVFVDKIKELNPDVIHLHNIHGYYLNYQVLFEYLKKAKKRVIWTLHDCWSFTGHCSHYDYINCQKWQTKCRQCPQKREYPKSLLRDNSEKNFNLKKELFLGLNDLTIITPSQWLAQEVKKSFLKNYKVKVINNGIDLDVFKPIKNKFRSKHNIKNKFIILGVASVWSERKGLNYFIELSKLISKDEKIVLVGLNKKQLEELPKNIIGMERTESIKELTQIYTVSDVFINPTLEDSFPTTNLESLSCGTPVITFDTGGSVESIDENTGKIVKKEDTKGLLNAIKEIKKEKIKYKEMCIKKAKRYYNKKEKFMEYIEKYLQR